jgi:hypothetical protein
VALYINRAAAAVNTYANNLTAAIYEKINIINEQIELTELLRQLIDEAKVIS